MLSRDMSVLSIVDLRHDEEDELDEGYDPDEEEVDEDEDEDEEEEDEEYEEELDDDDDKPRRARPPVWD